MLQPESVFFILVRPTFLGNIGSVARVMKNFGFENLRLIGPPRNYKDAEARKMALGAFDLLKSAECFETLPEALSDINIAVGTTCAQQRICQTQPIAHLAAALKHMNPNRVAIVLGEERDGLKTEDLERCQFIATIPGNPEFPSLNLAQAAGIFAYELTRISEANAAREVSPLAELEGALATGSDADEFFEQLGKLLHDAGFTRTYNKSSIMSELRVLFNKAKPTRREQMLLNALLKKFQQSIGN